MLKISIVKGNPIDRSLVGSFVHGVAESDTAEYMQPTTENNFFTFKSLLPLPNFEKHLMFSFKKIFC